jgi:hypothetical protein
MDTLKTFLEKSLRYYKSGGEEEIEIRIGSFDKGKFNSVITQQDYNRITKSFKNPIVTESVDTIYHNTSIKKRDDIFINKIKKQQLNIPGLNMRISYNEEKVVSEPSGNSVIGTRQKHRISECHTFWRIDCTIVNDTIYELEYEFIGTSRNSVPDILNELKEVLTRTYPIIRYYHMTNNTRFIGNQPKTLERKDLSNVKANNQFMVTDKADGERRLLLGGICWITRNLEVCTDNISMEIPQGCLIDGEYLKDTNTFLAFDILYFNHKCITENPLKERLKILKELLKGIPGFQVKQFMSIRYSSMIMNSPRKYQLDGLIFTSVGGYYNDIFKWKKNVSIDVMIVGNSLITVDKGCLIDCSTLDTEYFNSKTIVPDPQHDCDIGEYYFEDGIWKLLGYRNDKIKPNARLTVMSALKAIKDNIRLQEFD